MTREYPTLSRIRSYVRRDPHLDRIKVVVIRDECYGGDDWSNGPWRQFYLGPDGEWSEYEGYAIIEPALSISGWIEHVVGLDFTDALKATVERETRTADAIHEVLRSLALEAAQK